MNAQGQVRLESQGGRYQLVRNGEPFQVKGAGGETHLDLLAASGGNSIRTWGSQTLGKVLDDAQSHQLTVCAGLWMGHPRHGFNYHDKATVRQQHEQKLSLVRKHKDHPAPVTLGRRQRNGRRR